MSTSLLLIFKSVFDIIHTFLFGFVPVCPLLAPQCIVKAIMDHLYWNNWSLFMHDLCACPSPLSVLHLCHISLPPPLAGQPSAASFPHIWARCRSRFLAVERSPRPALHEGNALFCFVFFCKAPSDNLDCNRLFRSWMEVSLYHLKRLQPSSNISQQCHSTDPFANLS